MAIETHIFYGLKDTETGELLRLHECGQEHGDADYNQAYVLVEYTQSPVFEAKSLEQLASVLFSDTPSYNTSRSLPGWGGRKREQLVPVKVTVTQETEDLVLPEVGIVKTIQIRDLPLRVAQNYAGFAFEQDPDTPGLVFWLVQLPEGETVDSARPKWVGGPVYGGDRYTKRHLYAAVAVPEEYEPLTAGKGPCAVLIASGTY